MSVPSLLWAYVITSSLVFLWDPLVCEWSEWISDSCDFFWALSFCLFGVSNFNWQFSFYLIVFYFGYILLSLRSLVFSNKRQKVSDLDGGGVGQAEMSIGKRNCNQDILSEKDSIFNKRKGKNFVTCISYCIIRTIYN